MNTQMVAVSRNGKVVTLSKYHNWYIPAERYFVTTRYTAHGEVTEETTRIYRYESALEAVNMFHAFVNDMYEVEGDD